MFCIPSNCGWNGRVSGLLAHVSSLPGGHGIGDLGPAARRFLDFLEEAGQGAWQMLPVGPTGEHLSPYSSSSAFAGSPLLISLEDLAADGLLERRDLRPPRPFPRGRTAGPEAFRFKEARLRRAFHVFRSARRPSDFDSFRARNRSWLDDFTLFSALRGNFGGAPWTEWPAKFRRLRPGPARDRVQARLSEEVDYHRFLQYAFFRQWNALKKEAGRRRIALIGDIPIFVALDSADVWGRPELFHLDREGRMALGAGTPPDYFSRTGQLWNTPVYRWNVHRRSGYAWWKARFRHLFSLFDACRLDHFIGFLRCWAVPGRAKTAVSGSWLRGPGADLFREVGRSLGRLPVIAEDLGVVTPEVKALRQRFGFPGMVVLQFAFGKDPEARNYQPHNYSRESAAYTGTHDNDTVVGWFRDTGSAASTRSAADIREERAFALRYLAATSRDIHWAMIRAASASVSDLAVLPVQDLLGLGSEARMNRPGQAEGNWNWRLEEGALNRSLARRLRLLTETYGRCPARLLP